MHFCWAKTHAKATKTRLDNIIENIIVSYSCHNFQKAKTSIKFDAISTPSHAFLRLRFASVNGS
jgi:hypothetical protein